MRGWLRTSAGGPSTSVRPKLSTSAWVHTPTITLMTCSMSTIVTPPSRTRRTISRACSTSTWLSPAITSSSSSSRGRIASARATSSRLRSGTVRRSTVWCRFSPSPTRSRTSSASARAAAGCDRPLVRPNSAPIAVFSRTVMDGKGRTIWNVRPIPRRAIRYGFIPVIDASSQRMSPASGRVSPLMQLRSVVLPAPLGPMMPNTWPGSTVKVTPARALTPPNRLLTSRTASRLMPAPTLTLPRKRGREIARGSCAGFAQRLAEIPEREPALPTEEVDHAPRDEDHADRQQHAQPDLRVDGRRPTAGQRLDDELQGDGPGHRSQNRAGSANHGHQDHLHVVRDREDVLLVDEAVPLREDAAGQPGQGRRDAEGRNLVEGGVTANDGGRLFVLAERRQSVAEASAQDEPGAQDGEGGRPQHQVEEEQVRANDRKEKPGRGPEWFQVVDDFSNRHAHAQGRNGEVMAAQPEQWDADDQCEERRRQRRDDQRERKRPAAVADQHADGVGAEPEEGDVPEAGVPGQAADDIPGGRHHDEHGDGGSDPEPELVGQQRQAGLLRRVGGAQR